MHLASCCRANDEIEKVRKAQDSEIARLQAALKRAEVKVNSMEQTIEQRVSESLCVDQQSLLSLFFFPFLLMRSFLHHAWPSSRRATLSLLQCNCESVALL